MVAVAGWGGGQESKCSLLLLTLPPHILLQAYISQLKLEGLALMSDMVYVTQSGEQGWWQVDGGGTSARAF